MIPSASELEAWVAALETGHATTEILPRFMEAYRRLLAVAEKAREVAILDDGDWLHTDEEGEIFSELHDALDALELPEPAESPAQGTLFGTVEAGR